MTLTEQDAQAVDALLDPYAGADGAGGFVAATPVTLGAHVARVDALLKLLDHWRDEDEPSDLVRRTMGRLGQDGAGDAAAIGVSLPEAFEPGVAATGESLHLKPSPAGEEGSGTA